MNYLSNELIVPPAVEPVSLADLKRQLRLKVDSNREDNHLTLLIEAARSFFETTSGRAFITQTWRMVIDSFPRVRGTDQWWDGVRQGAMVQNSEFTPIQLPRAPIKSVSAIRTYNSADVSAPVAATAYKVDSYNARVSLRPGQYWPADLRLTGSAVEIDYVLGYGDVALAVPAAIRMGIMQLAAHWYENRVPIMQGSGVNTTEVPLMFSDIAEKFKVRRV